jgi:hypothetical protein
METGNIWIYIGGEMVIRKEMVTMGSMRNNMSVTMPLVFPSIPKEEIVESFFVIDVNP